MMAEETKENLVENAHSYDAVRETLAEDENTRSHTSKVSNYEMQSRSLFHRRGSLDVINCSTSHRSSIDSIKAECQNRRASIGEECLRQNLLRKSLSNSIISIREAGIVLSSQDLTSYGSTYGPERRTSLGGESLAEHDLEEPVSCTTFITHHFEVSPLDLLGEEYSSDIFSLKKELEESYHPKNCLQIQPQITEPMRCTVVNWLTKISRQLDFNPETLFLAVNFFDRFLATAAIASDCLQLLAICSLFVSSKMEEIKVPGTSVLVTLCAPAYKRHHFLRMEILLLTKLGFCLNAPTTWYFLNHLSMSGLKRGILGKEICDMALSVAETSLCHYDVTQYEPSVIAAASLLYASVISHSPPTSPTFSSSSFDSSLENGQMITQITNLQNDYSLAGRAVQPTDLDNNTAQKTYQNYYRGNTSRSIYPRALFSESFLESQFSTDIILELLTLYEENYEDSKIDEIARCFHLMKLKFAAFDELTIHREMYSGIFIRDTQEYRVGNVRRNCSCGQSACSFCSAFTRVSPDEEEVDCSTDWGEKSSDSANLGRRDSGISGMDINIRDHVP